MAYQFKREPLTQDEANRLAQACSNHQEKLVILTLLDTGLRVSELAELTRENLDWQMHRLMIYGKGSIRNQVKASHHSPILSHPATARGTLSPSRQVRDRCQDNSAANQVGCE